MIEIKMYVEMRFVDLASLACQVNKLLPRAWEVRIFNYNLTMKIYIYWYFTFNFYIETSYI